MSEASSGADSAAIPAARRSSICAPRSTPPRSSPGADAFGGLLGSASRWLRRNGVGPRDVVSLLAPNCTATSVVYWAAMSSAAVQPLNLLFTREAIAAQVGAVGAKILFTPPPGAPGGLFEKVEGLRALAPRLERIVVLPLDGGRRLRRRGDRPGRRRERTAGRRRTRGRAGSRRRAAADRRDDRRAQGGSAHQPQRGRPRRSPRCSPAIFAPTIAYLWRCRCFMSAGRFARARRVSAQARLWSSRPPRDFATPRSSRTFGASSRRSA